MLGSQRSTIDLDYVGDDLQLSDFQRTIAEVASEMHVHVDPVPIERFVPLPPEADSRRLFIARFGPIEVFVVDPYVIALSKVDRGLDTDVADIVFLVERGLVNLDLLADLVVTSLRQAAQYDMDPAATLRHLTVVRQRVGET